MRIRSKLARWQEAGLLTEAQSGAILAHEKQHMRFSWQGGLAFLGVFAIVIGFVSIVASNWLLTPPWLKLTGHLLMLVALGSAILGNSVRLTPLVKELCLLAWSGLTLSFIGLMGQVFHLAGSFTDALLLWITLITPAVVVLAYTRLVIVPWLLATLMTLVMAYGEYLAQYFAGALAPLLLAGAVLPALLLVLSPQLTARPELRHQLAQVASLLPVVTSSVACQLWYAGALRSAVIGPADFILDLTLASAAGALVALGRMDVPGWLARPANLRLLLSAAMAFIVLPFLLPHVQSGVLAAASFSALWLLLGWIGQRTGNARLSGLAILVVTLRIFLVYVEVFGTLLLTGFGLIASGVFLLLMLRVAQTLNRKLCARRQMQMEENV